MPIAQMKLNNPQADAMKYYMTEHCGVRAGMAGGMGYALGCVMGLFLYGGQADMAMAQGTLQPEYKGFRRELRQMKANMHRQGKQFGTIGRARQQPALLWAVAWDCAPGSNRDFMAASASPYFRILSTVSWAFTRL